LDRDVRSIAHLKMLQSLSGKLSRLNDVREIGMVIANELRSLIDYHNCRVFVVDGEDVVPIAFQGGLATSTTTVMEVLACKLGEAERREAESAKALLEFSRELASASGLDEVLERTVELAASLLGSPRTAIWLDDPGTGELVCRAAWGQAADDVLHRRFTGDEARPVVARPDAFLVRREELPGVEPVPLGDNQILIAPLTLEHGRFGCVSAEIEDVEDAERKLRLIAGIAHQAQLAIANARSFENLEGTFFSTVEA